MTHASRTESESGNPALAPTLVTADLVVESLVPRRSLVVLVAKAVRVHQWAKNALIFAPLVFAHRLGETALVLQALLAFAAFTLVASSVYLVNDLLDLESDRRHPDNRRRPFASGELPLTYGYALTPLLLGGGLALAAFQSWAFFAVVAGYYGITLAYSLKLKRVVLADVMILAFLYAWRVFAGAVATGIDLTHWFLACFGFLFFSLALVKRCSELILTAKHGLAENARRGYLVSDLGQLVNIGTASGYIAVLVLALYISSDVGTKSYKHPELLWLVCPLLLYWVSRMWLMAHRGDMTSDPLVFSLKDKVSWGLVIVAAAIWSAASGYFF